MKTKDLSHVRSTLWNAADELRANSTLAPNEYWGHRMGPEEREPDGVR
jgi:type I restriction enzyme M protein